MKSKAIFGTTFTLLLVSMLAFAFNIQPVKASGTIYIRADGSVEGTNKIQRDGNIYTFTDNIYDEIVIERDNIVIDGAGYTLQGTGDGTGLYLDERRKVTIKNMEIESFGVGIWLRASSNYNTISGNKIENNSEGIFFYGYNNILSGNNITGSKHGRGISFTGGSDSTISANIITNNCLGGIFLKGSNNTVSGNIIAANWGWDGDGITLSDSNYNVISGNHITGNNRFGINLYRSSNNTISGNNITGNKRDGILLYEFSNYNIISGNDVTANNEEGIDLQYGSSHNRFHHNNFVDNVKQVSSDNSINFWDDGYPSGGNYWSDHVCTGNPSDGSQPYVIDENNKDHYPFQDPSGWLPVADAGPDQTVDEDTLVTFDGSNSTDSITSYTWTFVDVTPRTLTGITVSYTYAMPGVYMVTLNVTDAGGNWDIDEVVITVLDVTDPIADTGPDQTASEDRLVTLGASNSTDNVEIVNYVWTFVDVTHQTLSGATVTYSFAAPGVYTVTLSVTDAAGNWDTDTVTITVLKDTDGDGTPDVTDTDDDNDGMPDTWETANAFNSLDAADASLDRDGDGLTNLQELQGGTDPSDYFSPFPFWIVGVAAAAIAGVAVVVYLVKVRKP